MTDGLQTRILEVFSNFTAIRKGVHKSEVSWREEEWTEWTEPWNIASEFKVTLANGGNEKQTE